MKELTHMAFQSSYKKEFLNKEGRKSGMLHSPSCPAFLPSLFKQFIAAGWFSPPKLYQIGKLTERTKELARMAFHSSFKKEFLNKEGRKSGRFHSPLFLSSCLPYFNNSMRLVDFHRPNFIRLES
jgi:hypothetical protein